MNRALAYLLGVTLILSSLYLAQKPGVLPYIPSAQTTSAASVELMGYAWSENIGWISVNCANTSTCGVSNYKVTLDTATNNLSGYAWSEHIGWIQFGGLTGCPAGTCDARMDGSELKGWARVVTGDTIPAVPVVTNGTSTFATAGSHSFTVPTGVTSLRASLAGAGGAPSTSTLAVTPGETLTVNIGSGGATTTLKRGATTLANGGGPGLTFASPVNYTTATGPYTTYSDDVNNDAKPDIATTNFNSNSVSILLGNGNGTFGAKADFIMGTGPITSRLADFNGDGNLDLVTANQNSNNVSIRLGNGIGGFGARTDYPTGARPTTIIYFDVNVDNKLDVVTGNMTGNSISVLLGNGNGTFAAKTDYTTGTSPFGLRSGDFNGDGKIDLEIVNGGSDSVSVFLNSGTGTFPTRVDYSVGDEPHSSAVADADADGKLDIVSSNKLSSTLSILFGVGDGTFMPKVDYTTGLDPMGVYLADINNDVSLDMVNTNSAGNSVSVFINNGNGTFAPRTNYTTGTNPSGLFLKDLNADSKVDIIWTNFGGGSGNTASVMLNTTPFSLGSAALSYISTTTNPTNGSDGWISLSCANTNSCGTTNYTTNVGANELTGYAWGSDVVGWISMNCSDEGTCATSNYRVYFNSPCSVGYACTVDNSASVYTDPWCTTATTTCNAGEMCRTDMGSICGPGNPTGQLMFTSQRVRKGNTTNISWPALAAYDMCRVDGTPSGGTTDSWTWSSTTPLANVTTSAIQNEVTYTLRCTQVGDVSATYQLLDTERVTLLPSIKEF